MKVSIVVPPFDYGRFLYGMMRRRSFHNAVPLGAICVGACLREAGHEVQVIDAPALDIDGAGVVERLRRFSGALSAADFAALPFDRLDASSESTSRTFQV